MNKTELVDKIAAKSKLTKKDSTKILDAVITIINSSLSKGDKVTLVGFGSFDVRKRAARKGRNPQSGKEITIVAKKVPIFKAGKALKDIVAK